MGTRINLFLNHIVYWFFSLVYTVLVFRKYKQPEDSFLNNYLADFLCIPLVLYFTKIVLDFLFRTKKVEMNVIKIFVAVIYFSVIFEWILPKYSRKFTSDWIDVLMYFLGGILFYCLKKAASYLAASN